MSDPKTFWLTVTNIILGVLVLLLLWGIVAGTICDLVARFRKRRAAMREMDREMKDYFHQE
jgi:uncharacterized membrane protein